MQLIKIVFIGLLVIFPWSRHLSAQSLNEQEYKVINDLFGCMRDSEKYHIYQYLVPDSVFKYFIGINPDNLWKPVYLDKEEFHDILDNFSFDSKKMDSLDRHSYILENSKLERGIKIKKSQNKGKLISRPLISDRYAIIYSKDSCISHREEFIIAKKMSATGTWVYYGDILISESFVDPLIPKNWRWRKFWWSINIFRIFRDKYCD
ncbi:hypothetical protein [Algoriphagus marincola]|uniref:hypothetical protein n=1 Tax=Algoriphagus marincola TaxID=264027 RepID=UPI0004039605|nr:hypothetical protein [Algoriphagus marincola]